MRAAGQNTLSPHPEFVSEAVGLCRESSEEGESNEISLGIEVDWFNLLVNNPNLI
jgi:hypothetical protein